MPAPTHSPFASLRHRNFRLFYAGQTASLVGTWMQTLALGWLVLQLTDSAFWVGLVAALGSLPVLLFSLPAGAFADRVDKRRVVMVCQAILMLTAAALALLVGLGRVAPWQVAALAALAGLVNAFEIPARQAFIVELVGKDDLTNAIALNASAFNAARIVGPAIAGVLVARIGLTWCFVLNAASYLAVLAGLLAMRMPPYVSVPAATSGVRRIVDGLRYVRGERRVLALTINTAVLSLFGFPFVVLLPVFARDELRVGAEGLGVMSAAIGIGALTAAVGLAVFGPRVRRGTLIAWGGPAFGVAVVGFALAPWYPLALAALGVAGFAMVLNNATANTLIQSLVPDALRGRVLALWVLVFIGFAPFGSLGAGSMAGLVGARVAVAIGGGVTALVSLWMWQRGAPSVRVMR